MQTNVDKLIAAGLAVKVRDSSVPLFAEVSDEPASEYIKYPVLVIYDRDMDMEQISSGLRDSYEGTMQYGVWIIDAPHNPNGNGGSYSNLDTMRSKFLKAASEQTRFHIQRVRSKQLKVMIGQDECFVDRIGLTINDSFKAA